MVFEFETNLEKGNQIVVNADKVLGQTRRVVKRLQETTGQKTKLIEEAQAILEEVAKTVADTNQTLKNKR